MEEHNNDRIVKQTHVGDIMISTVFLGLDYNFFDNGPPLLWETMLFAPDLPKIDQRQWRFSTKEQASLHHQEVVELVEHATAQLQ